MALANPGPLRRYVGLALISGAVLALQVAFTRVFSLAIWYHFTYLVIGMAMLGGGAAGTFLAVKRWPPELLRRRVGWLAVAFSLCTLLSLVAVSVIQVDPLRARLIVQSLVGLAVYFALLFSMFFLGGLVVTAIFSMQARESHRLYFADMAGAALSTVAIVWVIQAIGGPGAIALVALLVAVAGVLLGLGQAPRRGWVAPAILLGQAGLLLFIVAAEPVRISIPESKELGWALRNYGFARPEYTRWNPVGRVDVLPEITVAEPMIVGGISRRHLAERPDMGEYDLRLVTIDGTSMTGMYRYDGTEADLARFSFLEGAVIAAPFQLGIDEPAALQIGVGGGMDLLLARYFGASTITAIDLNADIVALLKGPYADYTGRLAEAPGTTLSVAEGRSFLSRGDERYDIIQGIGLDNLAALSGGAYVMAESYIYTTDALGQAIDRLTPRGVFSWTRDVNAPPREMLRLTGLAAEALRQRGVERPGDHIAIVANDSGVNATLLVAREPFSAEAIARLRAWAEGNGFSMLQDPLARVDTVFADYLYAADPRAFEEAYVFNIYPVGDDNPFFYNYFKWTNLHFNDAYQGRLNRFPIGNLILLTLCGLTLASAAALIVFPLWRYQRAGLRVPGAGPALAYFALLGMGYIFVQIVLIQRFTLFVGYPTHAITTTIASMLFFSALGSLAGRRWCSTPGRLQLTLLAIAGLIGAYVAGLPVILPGLLHLPDLARILVCAALIAPLALLMGMPFPTGLRQIGASAPSLVPWAWGMNGVFSVLGSVLVIMVSMLSSFTVALLVGALCYGAAAAVAPALLRARVVAQGTAAVPEAGAAALEV